MKIDVKKLDSAKRHINIEASPDVVKEKFADVFKRLAKEAKIPGFRPGNAPLDMVEKHYAKEAHEQVLKELVPDLYNKAIDKEGIDVIDLPEISDVKLERAALSFKAKVEVSPEIKLKDYKGLKLNYKKVSVSEEEVKRFIDSLKEARKLESVDDGFARSLGYPDLKELEGALEKQLFIQKENQQRQKIESELLDGLVKDLDFKVPQSLVNRQLQDMLRNAKVELAMKGVSRDKIEEQSDELTKSLEPEAKKQVKVYLILAEIAKREKIPVDDFMPRRVTELLLKEASWKEEV